MKSLIPVILAILVLTGAITYILSKNSLPKQVTKQESVSPNELEVDNFMTPTPTATPTTIATAKNAPTPTATPKVSQTDSKATVPTITEKKSTDEDNKDKKDGEEGKIVDAKTKKVINKSTICTPVYGTANTCVEHEVVDTAGEDMIFLNLAGFSYLLGLGAFIKAKQA